ncbi:MAG: lipase family protein [Syntrophaceae bacterium]|nr:lipase family protein [Syntrophaceae bacterium]
MSLSYNKNEYFRFPALLEPPILRAAYSDRTAWLMAEMSRLAYTKFEDSEEKKNGLRADLKITGFNLVDVFNGKNGTQAFLATREQDKMAVLAFRGTEKTSWRDIKADIDARFYTDSERVMIHNGFYLVFSCVEQLIREKLITLDKYALYVTGHSLGGALALIATRALNSDNLAACYTFGSPKVGNGEFADIIKPPIYRVVNYLDPVPCLPDTYLVNILNFFLRKFKKIIPLLEKLGSYAHHGDQRFLTPCNNPSEVKVRANYNEILRTIQMVAKWIKNRKIDVDDHAIGNYCEKLAQYGLKRIKISPKVLNVKVEQPVYASKKGGLTLNVFNSYERYARVYPAILLVMPLVIACYSITPLIEGPIFTKLLANGTVIIALLVLFSNIVRGFGKKIEPKLWQKWGGPPSTRFLRKDDGKFNSATKEKFYKKVLAETGIDLTNDLTDAKIEQAFMLIREVLRRKDKEGLWIKSNQEYGFERNLLGSRMLMVVFSFICALSCFFLILFFPNDSTKLLIGGGLDIIYGVWTIIYGWFVLPGLTKGVADRYAEQAITAYLTIQ